METDDLMQFFENVYVKNISYCAICLRSEEEVRLSAPLVFRKILGALKYLDSFRNENICYMCEARASAMARFVDMIQLALEIQIAFQRTTMSTGKKRRKRARENADTYQSVFTRMRSQNKLRSTQVLHVDGELTNSSRPSGPKGTSQVIGKNNNDTKQAEIETVIIDDDNPQDSCDPLTDKTNTPHTDNMSAGSDSLVYIMPVYGVVPNTVYLMPTSSGTPNPSSEVNNSGACILPEVSPKVKKPRKAESVDDDVEIVTDDDCLKSNGREQLVEVERVGEVVKLPVKTDPRVDWEDMIPMEVIACADEKPVNNTILRDATKDLLKDLQNVINMGTIDKPI